MAHAFLGVATAPGRGGALIEGVARRGPAAKSGLRTGDVIFSLDGSRVRGPDALAGAVAARRPDQAVTLRHMRAGKEHTARVTLGTRPD